MEDNYRHKGLRRGLVNTMIKKGIANKPVLDAIGKVPRHVFFDNAFLEHAYQDKAFPIGEGQTISQPYTVAFQTDLVKAGPGAKILEIGTGSGYQCCVLMELGAEVYTIEYNKVLFERTKKFLPEMGYRPHFFHGDGSMGLPMFAPYDGIIVTAGAPSVPQALVDQLKPEGRLIIPVGDGKTQKMLRIIKKEGGKLTKETFDNFSFVPLLGEKGWSKK